MGTQGAAPPARVVSRGRDQVGESPVWDAVGQALYWVDIQSRHVHRLAWPGETQQTWLLPERVGCIALAERGGLIAAMETGVFEVELLAPPAVRLRRLASVAHAHPHMRFNDGRCDAAGRFWLSTLCMDGTPGAAVGVWYCLDERGLRGPLRDGLVTPNGSAFSPDGRTLYLSDSHASVQKIWAFDYDLERGEIGAGRLFADMAPLPGRPDGAAVDAEGYYWICANDAGLVHRFDPDGRLVGSIPVPVRKPAMCAFGGAQLDTLFVTSIQPPDPGPDDGALFALQPGVRGLPEPRFARYPTA